MLADNNVSQPDAPSPVSLGHYATVAIDSIDCGHAELPLDQWQSVAGAYVRFRNIIRDAYSDCTAPGMPDGPA